MNRGILPLDRRTNLQRCSNCRSMARDPTSTVDATAHIANIMLPLGTRSRHAPTSSDPAPLKCLRGFHALAASRKFSTHWRSVTVQLVMVTHARTFGHAPEHATGRVSPPNRKHIASPTSTCSTRCRLNPPFGDGYTQPTVNKRIHSC